MPIVTAPSSDALPVPGPDSDPDGVGVLVLCTGNAARSVMAGYMLEHLAEAQGHPVSVITAGTHTVSGQPMSMRTRAALTSIAGLGDAPVARHRSRQLTPVDLAGADLVVAMEADHVRYVRRHHPEAADRTATLRRLAADLPAGPEPLAVRVASLVLADAEPDDAEDVADPAGRDDAVYVACAAEIWELTRELVSRL
jgi:protein-tyrosine phosphatase